MCRIIRLKMLKKGQNVQNFNINCCCKNCSFCKTRKYDNILHLKIEELFVRQVQNETFKREFQKLELVGSYDEHRLSRQSTLTRKKSYGFYLFILMKPSFYFYTYMQICSTSNAIFQFCKKIGDLWLARLISY